MKRDKYIFTTLLIPFFLFSLNLRLSRFDIDDKTAFWLMQHETQSLKKEDLHSSKSKQSVQEKASLKHRPSLARKTRGKKAESLSQKILRKIRPENLASFRPERKNDGNSSFKHKNFMLSNGGNLYRSSGRQYVPGQVLVKFKPTLTEEMREACIAAYQSRKIKRIPRLNIYQLQTPEGVSVEEMLYLLGRNPDVEYAEPNYIRRLTVTPNDSFFNYQYALRNSGQIIGPPGSPQGSSSADIKATEGWEETMKRGEPWEPIRDEDVVIAILDTGVDFNHPDLDDKLLSNGYDFVYDDSDPTDDFWHGTHVAGIAAAETNNGEGIAGVAWSCKILPLKVVFTQVTPPEEPYAETGWIVDAIQYAVDNGAHVINISLGGDFPSQSERDAVRYAYNRNVIVVASVGNGGGAVLYPAAYDEIILGVAATDYNDLRPTWSNTGPEIDVAAPGDEIFSCVPEWLLGPDYYPYLWGTGTSSSAPHAAGLAALIRSVKPNLSAEDIMNVIRYTADDVNSANYPGRDNFIGYGRINMKKALVPIIISSLNNKKND